MDLTIIMWIGLGILVIGSLYLLWEGFRVYKLFSNSIVGRLVKTLVVVLLIELYSLGVASFAFASFAPSGVYVLLPVVFLWMCSLGYAIFAVRQAHKEVKILMK